jgi:hypothetical protein
MLLAKLGSAPGGTAAAAAVVAVVATVALISSPDVSLLAAMLAATPAVDLASGASSDICKFFGSAMPFTSPSTASMLTAEPAGLPSTLSAAAAVVVAASAASLLWLVAAAAAAADPKSCKVACTAAASVATCCC